MFMRYSELILVLLELKTRTKICDFKKEKLRADNERMAKEKESVVRIIDKLLCWYFQLLGRLLQKTHSSSLLPPKDRSPTLRKRALKWVLLGAEVRAEMDVFGR
ncbi:hypothetical protein Tco_0458003 [Tanacetum coccineum]